ncbi:hypothetical protein HX746_18310 [Rhodococcus erythropolis]|nr:hypothetical protein [Rhodococcus erythropolis]
MSESLFSTPRDEIEETIRRGARVESYKREWRVGRTEVVDDVLTGRIGFSGHSGIAELWDDDEKDFLDEPIARGLTTTFAIHLDRRLGYIQDRKPDITVDAVIRALTLMLNNGRKEKDTIWSIESRQGTRNLQEWLRTVKRVTRVSLVVKEPNPNWQGVHDLKEMMEAAEAETVRVEMESDRGINMNSQFLTETQIHIDRGYGDARYTGVREDENGEHQSTFNTSVGVEELNDELVAQENGEVDQSTLRSHLVRTAASEETVSGERDTST